ncbi:uncharacterized protein [Maniola hyperantus]|uniref:uncharacterized protein n=1 Tax=Aphantopus hyperantus TaxID=2795564 RepID=UPI003749BBC6
MKVIFVAILALAVGASALPEEYGLENRDQRNIIVENQIIRAIEHVSQAIRDNGLDPLRMNRMVVENSPVPGVDLRLLIEGLDCIGLSHIVPETVNWSTLTSRLRLNIALPGILCSLRNSGLEINYHGDKHDGELRGEFELTRLAMTFDVRLNISVISGMSIRSLICTLRIQKLWSDLELVINKQDYSRQVNDMINDRIPTWMHDNRDKIDKVLGDALKEIGNHILSRS